jgi:hypothetical protein
VGERKIAYCDLVVLEKLTARLNKYRIVFTKALADFFTFGCLLKAHIEYLFNYQQT